VRRIPACLSVIVALALLAPAAALASTVAKPSLSVWTGARHSVMLPESASAGRSVAALPAGSYTISGTVLAFNGTAENGATVYWGRVDPTTGPQVGGQVNVGADGTFQFQNVSSLPGHDDLLSVYDFTHKTLGYLESWNNDFQLVSSYVVQPAEVTLNVQNAPASFAPQVGVFGTGGQAQSWPSITGGTGTPMAPPPSFNDVVVSDVRNTAVPTDLTVTTAAESLSASDASVAAGAVAPAVTLDWSAAQQAYLAGAACQHSGKPGSAFTVVVKGWPAGEKAGFELAGFGANSITVTSAGPSHTYRVKLVLPKTIRAGGVYGLATVRADATTSHLAFVDYFQVCTLTPSATSVRLGKTVRLSGKVPTTSGSVYLYSRHTAAGQPATTAAKGWVKLGRYTLKSGKFATGLLHPTRTTWYVLRYGAGHGAAFAGYTSVTKVTVR
jgi:hypothetical protein